MHYKTAVLASMALGLAASALPHNSARSEDSWDFGPLDGGCVWVGRAVAGASNWESEGKVAAVCTAETAANPFGEDNNSGVLYLVFQNLKKSGDRVVAQEVRSAKNNALASSRYPHTARESNQRLSCRSFVNQVYLTDNSHSLWSFPDPEGRGSYSTG